MVDKQATRRLAAIVSADVVGYSRLMGEDETATLEAMKAHRRALWTPEIEARGGRVVGTAGDSFLVELQSVVAAVECAIAIQRGMADSNSRLPEDRRMLLRVGINIGDVVVDGDDIFGDGVNVAARLEALAEPGGICASDDVVRQIQGKLEPTFTDGGLRGLKNISAPVHVWHWLPEKPVPASAAVSQAVLERPDKPSIAVLPFDNMSDDSEQAYFADGMTEDIITGLSRFRSLFVIARNSCFAYKGQSPDVRQVARDLGVRYVLEGSVRRGGQRIRITAQLIDGPTGNHLWAERYDRALEDVFAVQDEVTEAIVAAIAPEVSEAERARAQRQAPGDLDAWGRYQRGLADYYTSTEAGIKSAIDQFDKVNEIDPTFALGFAMSAAARWRHVQHFDPDNPTDVLEQAMKKAYTAITLDPRDATGIWNAGEVHSLLGQHDLAISKLEQAVALNPTDAVARYFLGSVLRRAGRSEEAIAHIDHAMRLSPHDIWITGMLTDRAFVLFDLERYEEAYDWAKRARLSPNPRTMTFAIFAAILSKLGRMEQARAAVDDLLAHMPELTYRKYRENRFGTPDVMERLAGALRDAGLPE